MSIIIAFRSKLIIINVQIIPKFILQKKRKMNIGLFGIGLEAYWAQFDGLKDRLIGYQNFIARKMEGFGVTVIDAGMVDSPEKANIAADFLKKKDVDIVFLYISTYALSSTVLPIAKKLKVPLVILNLQPVSAIHYETFNALKDRGIMTGEWLAYCQACSVPEIANVFNRSGIKYEIVTGYLHEDQSWTQISEWIEASKVMHAMQTNRLGILGHYYGGMLDIYTDLTQLSAAFGTHMEIMEMCELKKYRDEVTKAEMEQKVKAFQQIFDVSTTCEEAEVFRAAKTSVALDKLVSTHNLSSMAYYYEGIDGNEYENISTSVIPGNTLLTGKNIPVAGECDVKNALAMKIMDSFGAGGSYSEFYAMDFDDDIVMLGHDGPAHFAIAEGRVELVPLAVYHGKPGKGLSIQMSVKQGEVTLLSVAQGKNGLFLLVAEAASVPGPVLQIGNTNSRYRFPIGSREFINRWAKQGPAHHCAIGTGHLAEKIKKFAFLMEMEVVQIC